MEVKCCVLFINYYFDFDLIYDIHATVLLTFKGSIQKSLYYVQISCQPMKIWAEGNLNFEMLREYGAGTIPTNTFVSPLLGKCSIPFSLETYPQSITYYFVEIGTSSDTLSPNKVTIIASCLILSHCSSARRNEFFSTHYSVDGSWYAICYRCK